VSTQPEQVSGAVELRSTHRVARKVLKLPFGEAPNAQCLRMRPQSGRAAVLASHKERPKAVLLRDGRVELVLERDLLEAQRACMRLSKKLSLERIEAC
jgi:hypothetical protein